ncbi:MAG: DUF4129 domain-containing protein [Gramella sp.]|nr:DUF4129 domain-containing protein [Christiangramia sp.]
MKKGFLIILLLLSFGRSYPQENDTLKTVKEVKYDDTKNLIPLKFDEAKIAEYKNLKDFDYVESAEYDSWWTRFKRWIAAKYNDLLFWLFGDYDAGSFLSIFISILPYVLLFILLGLVIWLFSRLDPGGRILKQPKISEVAFSSEEELVRHEDLPVLIAQAVSEGNYRLAVRYYYLNELRKLDELEHIAYEYQKTNKDYAEEIENRGIRKHFNEITKLYEFIWYGSFKVSHEDYNLVEKGFLEMEKVLNIKGNE